MKDKLADVISRINKLLRLASSSDKPGEVATAQSLAQELITKYQIEEAQLNGHVGEGNIASKLIHMPKPYTIDKSILLNAIAKHNFCKVLRGSDYAVIYGYSSDIEICTALYDILVLHMINEMHNKLKLAKKSNDQLDTKAWVKSFFGGYAASISQRIQDSKARTIDSIETNNASVALVVRDKQHAIEEYYQNLNRTKSKDRVLNSTDGFKSGVDSGKNANINQAITKEQ